MGLLYVNEVDRGIWSVQCRAVASVREIISNAKSWCSDALVQGYRLKGGDDYGPVLQLKVSSFHLLLYQFWGGNDKLRFKERATDANMAPPNVFLEVWLNISTWLSLIQWNTFNFLPLTSGLACRSQGYKWMVPHHTRRTGRASPPDALRCCRHRRNLTWSSVTWHVEPDSCQGGREASLWLHIHANQEDPYCSTLPPMPLTPPAEPGNHLRRRWSIFKSF